MNKVEKLSDLKTGMRVKVRNGNDYIVMKDTLKGDILSRVDEYDNDGFLRLSNYKEDFTDKEHSNYDIINVYVPKSVTKYGRRWLEEKAIKILYDRE